MIFFGNVASSRTTLSAATSSGLYLVKNSETERLSDKNVGTLSLVISDGAMVGVLEDERERK